MSVSDGNFSWVVEGENGERKRGRSIGSSRPYPRREYKDTVKDFSKRGLRCRITIFDATSEQARDCAFNINHEQTRRYEFRPHFHREDPLNAVGWTERNSEIDQRELLEGMSYQDKQERWAQEMLAKYGIVPAYWYKPNSKIRHKRHITDSRAKSVLVRKRRS